MAQVITGVVLGAAGFFIGGPAGAAIGFGVGMALGAPAMSVPGQKLGEINKQTSAEGGARPIIFGQVRMIGGNLICCQEPPRIVKRKQKSGGGKGGGSKGSSTTTEHPYRTYAIGVCEGPIDGYGRIWRNGKLVYDGRPGSEWGEKNNASFLSNKVLYLGNWEQVPNASLQSVFGENTGAFRGTAYLAIIDEDLSDTGGAVPQFQFEVIRNDPTVYLTSLVYESSFETSLPYIVETQEQLQSGLVAITGGSHRKIIIDYEQQQPEKLKSDLVAITSGNHRNIVLNQFASEQVSKKLVLIESGTHNTVVKNTSLNEKLEKAQTAILNGTIKDHIRYNIGIEKLEKAQTAITGGSHG